jgi:Ca-activated chloride channel homolog
MKFLQILFGLFLICVTGSFAFSQEKSKEKDNKNQLIPIEIKANLLVMDTKNNYVNDIKQEDLKIFEDGVEQKITYFAKKKPILNIGIVMDNSGSVRPILSEFTMIGSTVVSNLRDSDEAFVTRFVDSDKIEVIQEWTSNKGLLNEALSNMFVEGGQSAVLDAIYLSADWILKRETKDKDKRYAILLVSDAEDRDSYYNFDEVAKLFKGTDLQVFLISYAENAPQKKKSARKLSNLLTLQTGGTTFTLSKKHTEQELIEVLKKLVYELRSNFVIGYTSTNLKRDGLPRKLSVEVADGTKGEKRQVVIRDGFTVPDK